MQRRCRGIQECDGIHHIQVKSAPNSNKTPVPIRSSSSYDERGRQSLFSCCSSWSCTSRKKVLWERIAYYQTALESLIRAANASISLSTTIMFEFKESEINNRQSVFFVGSKSEEKTTLNSSLKSCW